MSVDKSRCEIHGAKELKKQSAECQGPDLGEAENKASYPKWP